MHDFYFQVGIFTLVLIINKKIRSLLPPLFLHFKQQLQLLIKWKQTAFFKIILQSRRFKMTFKVQFTFVDKISLCHIFHVDLFAIQ